jgi:flagellar hook-associated protein 3 FlgL
MRVDPFYIQGLSTALDNITSNEADLSGELASGLRVSKLSTDPVAVGQSTVLSAAISAADSYVQVATSTTSKLQVTDSTLGEVVTALTKAISLAVSGGDGTLGASDKAIIGQQIVAIRDQILGLANASYQGQYIFSGSQGHLQPFTLNSTTTPAKVTYAGDSALQYTTTPNGQKIQTDLAGSSLFTAPGAGVFTALNTVIADFASNASSTQIGSDAAQLTTALNTVDSQRSIIGTSLSQIQTSSTYAQTTAAQFTASETNLISADAAQVATQLSTAETQGQALSNVIASLAKGSLFDYIK